MLTDWTSDGPPAIEGAGTASSSVVRSLEGNWRWTRPDRRELVQRWFEGCRAAYP